MKEYMLVRNRTNAAIAMTHSLVMQAEVFMKEKGTQVKSHINVTFAARVLLTMAVI